MGNKRDIQDEVRSSGVFDRFAAVTGKHISRAWFFSACVISCVVWALVGPVFQFSEGWQLVINTGTTILTFLLVALIQNTQDRTTQALNHKLDTISVALAMILEDTSHGESKECIAKLRELAGVEMEASK